MNEIVYLPATEVLSRFRARTLSPVEYLDALRARTDETDPMVNAVAERLFDEASEAARDAEALYATRPDDARPLEGLPVAAKAEHPIAGRLFTDGSLAFAQRTVDVTHPIIARIQAAGGIVHLRTTTPLNDAGIRIEPPMSEPVARGAVPDARDAPEPPEDPPGL
jgi:aspartyl-tRNA(Asn)/glutamyl-tRNA(Gln) amidotransferase subunit A